MSKNTAKPAPKSNAKSNAKSSEKTPSPSKTAGNKGKKPAAKSTLTAATTKPATVKTVPIVATMGQMIDTQEVGNRLGRNWQFVNRQRHAGRFIDHSAILKTGGTYLYKVSAVRAWAKQNGYPFAN